MTENKDFSLMHHDFEAIRTFARNNQNRTHCLIIDSIETEREEERKALSEESIGEMLVNIDKFHSLKKSLELWYEVKNPPNAPH
jgi:hypothetical protein